MSFDLRILDGDDGLTAIGTTLATAGAGGLDGIGPSTTRFEELLRVPMAPYQQVAGEQKSGIVAEVWLPLEFEGVLTVPEVPGISRPEVTLASSIEVVRQQESIAEVIGLPLASVPAVEPDSYVLNGWHASLTPSDDPAAPRWERDPDVAFYVALFWSAARFSIEHRTPIAYA